MSTILEDVIKVMEKIDDGHNFTVEKTSVGYQTSMLQLCHSLAKNLQDLVNTLGIFTVHVYYTIVVTTDTEGYIFSRRNGWYMSSDFSQLHRVSCVHPRSTGYYRIRRCMLKPVGNITMQYHTFTGIAEATFQHSCSR